MNWKHYIKIILTVVLASSIIGSVSAESIPNGWNLSHTKIDDIPVVSLVKTNKTGGAVTIMWNYVTEDVVLFFERTNQEKITMFDKISVDGKQIQYSKDCHNDERCLRFGAIQIPLGRKDFKPMDGGLVLTFKYKISTTNKLHEDNISLIGSSFALSEFFLLVTAITNEMDKQLDINQS